MNRFVATAVAALIASASAQAQETVRVRAGEHPAYSRIVIDAPSGAAFEWGVEGRLLRVAFDEGAFNTAPAEGVRGLSRIAGFTSAGAVLDVALSCECGARVTRLSDGRIILDVAAGSPRPALPPAPSPEPVAEARAVAPPAVEDDSFDAAGRIDPPTPRARPSRGPLIDIEAESAERIVEAQPSTDMPAAAERHVAPPPPSPADAAPETAPAEAESAHAETAPPTEHADGAGAGPDVATIEEARRRLLASLTQAAEDGLLKLNDPAARQEEMNAKAEESDAEDRADAHAKAEREQTEPSAPPPIRIRTSREIARDRAILERETPAEEPLPEGCLQDQAFAVETWSKDTPLAMQIGNGRRALIGEFDAPRSRAVIAYARLLIRSGFGAEARLALKSFADTVSAPPELMDMAAIVDREPPADDGALAGATHCPGAHGLWALSGAALRGALDAETIDVSALRQPLSAMPPRLRAPVALPIADALLRAGRIDEAEMLTGIIARAEPAPPDGDDMLTVMLARIDAARGDHEQADLALGALIDKNSEAGVEAMIRMVEMRAARGVAPPPHIAETMEAVAFTQGSSQLGRRLLAAAAVARAMGEGLAPALDALSTLSERAGDAARAQAAARDMLIDYDPDPSEAAAYARAALDHWSMVGDGPDGDRARVAVATRLAGFGLGNLGEQLLAPALERGDVSARIAAATAALSAGGAERALSHLDGLSGPKAARVRAEASAALFRYDDAVREAAASGDADLEARYAWLAGQWSSAAQAGDVDQRILAAWMSGEGDIPEDVRQAAAADPSLAARMEAFSETPVNEGRGTLDDARAVLEEAQRRRALMGEVLTDG